MPPILMRTKFIPNKFFRGVITALLITIAVNISASVVIRGQVLDSITSMPVPFASIQPVGSTWAVQADDKGKFRIETNAFPDSLGATALGFSSAKISYKDFKKCGNRIYVALTGLALDNIYVRPKKEKYNKRNPAVDLMQKIRKLSDKNDPKRNSHYNYDGYERITIGLNNISPESNRNLILKNFDFLRSHIDTSEVSGRPTLAISTREKSYTYNYRKSPESEKEYIKGLRQEGLDDFLDQSNMQTLYEDFFKNIDIYQNDIDLLHNRLVSPLSKIAPDFYKFYLTDTVSVDSTRCIELSFVPRNSESFGFTGKIYVEEGDTAMFIKKVTMNVPKDINLNFIDGIYINQQFEKAPDGSRLLTRDDMIAEISILPGSQSLYFRRLSAFRNHDFETNQDPKIYDMLGSTIKHPRVYERDSLFWQRNRFIKLNRSESSITELTSGVRANKFYRFAEGFVKIMVNGYVKTGHDSKFDLGPVNTLVSHNTLEGFRFRVGGMSTANLSNRFFMRGYAAYGTRDHKVKYSGEVEYSFNDKRYQPREFPVHSIRAAHTYDINMIGQQYHFTNPDNMFLSLKRHEDNQINYLRSTKLIYTLELANNFSVEAEFAHERQYATGEMRFVTQYGRIYNHFDETKFKLQLRYAPGEKIYQRGTSRVSINQDIPVILFTQTYAPKGFMGSLFEINKTEFSISKRFWLSAFGYIDGIVKAGHIWSSVPYPDLLIPNANLSYTIQPESFALLNPMEFVTDSYASWDLSYWANGAIFNYIPYLKKLKLREIFSFRGIWGHLSNKNNPADNIELFRFPSVSHTQKLSSTPYMEAGVGIDNIFRILRLDYVWRLTYRNGPYADKGGFRVALHITF